MASIFTKAMNGATILYKAMICLIHHALTVHDPVSRHSLCIISVHDFVSRGVSFVSKHNNKLTVVYHGVDLYQGDEWSDDSLQGDYSPCSPRFCIIMHSPCNISVGVAKVWQVGVTLPHPLILESVNWNDGWKCL